MSTARAQKLSARAQELSEPDRRLLQYPTALRFDLLVHGVGRKIEITGPFDEAAIAMRSFEQLSIS